MQGAFITLFIYLSSLTYFIYLIYIWKSGEIIPKMGRYSSFNSEGNTFYLKNVPFYSNYEAYDNETLATLKNKDLYEISSKFFLNGDIISNDHYNPKCQVD